MQFAPNLQAGAAASPFADAAGDRYVDAAWALVLSLRTLRAVQAQPPLLGRHSANGWAFAVEDAAELMKVLKETMPKTPDCLTFYTRQPVTQAQLSALGLPVDGNYTEYPELALDYGLFAGGWFMACEITDGPEGYASVCTLKPAYDAWAYLDQYRRGLRDFLPAGIYAWSDAESVERTPEDYGPLTAAVAALDGTVSLPAYPTTKRPRPSTTTRRS